MEILKELTPKAILSMDDRALRNFVEDLNNFYWKNYHTERVLHRLKKEHEETLWSKQNNANRELRFRQNADLCRKQKTALDKIVFVIKCEDRFLTSREIYNLLKKYDPDLILRWNNPLGAVTQNLHLGVNDYLRLRSEIVRGKKEHYYGLHSFYEDGRLKEKYNEQLYN